MVKRLFRGWVVCLAMVSVSVSAQTTPTPDPAFVSTNLEAYPPNLSLKSGGAMMMLLASKDHTLFAPIYTDFEDLDGDGQLENTFNPTFRYYGYFDSSKCYSYNGNPGRGRLARFEPAEVTTAGTYRCPTAGRYWSGNFLNWATMTRLDVVRKLLYGGYRSEDLAGDTTLEMAQLGQDAHSFVKYYGGADIGDFTPYSFDALESAGLTICNRSTTQDATTGTPVIRVVKGNYSLWATIPSSQVCRWDEEGSFSFGQKAQAFYKFYGNDASEVRIEEQAHAESLPSRDVDGLKLGQSGPEYAVRVKACSTDFGTPTLDGDRCASYVSGTLVSYKPVGLLQVYGSTSQASLPAKAEFGLMTGSYDSPIVGGALRKNIGSLNDEIELTTGRYCYQMTTRAAPSNCKPGGTVVNGIVATFDRIRLFNAGNFNANLLGGREFVLPSDLQNGDFPSWGNPMSEMYVQALSYLAGRSVGTSGPLGNTAGRTNDSGLTLPAPVAVDPLDDTTVDAASGLPRSSLYGHGICRKSLTLAISSSAVSYDSDDSTEGVYSSFANSFVASSGGATSRSLAGWTDYIGQLEHINNTSRSVGSESADFGTDCTLKALGLGGLTAGGSYQGGLSSVAGVCPEAPAVKGSYLGAGAAFFARTTAIRSDSSLTVHTGSGINKESLPVEALRVKSYAASLSGGVARIEVPIPETNLFAVITPESLWAHQRLNGRLMPGAMLTFRAIGKQARNLALGFGGSGSYVVTWNDAQFGGDYDMDLVGFIRWTLRKSRVSTGKWELDVLTDVLNHNAGAKGSHGFSITGVEAATTSGTTQYKGSGKYITHGSNGFDAAGTNCGDEVGTVGFALHCQFTDVGFYINDVGEYDRFAWPTKYMNEDVDFINTGHTYTTTVSTKFLVSKESGTSSAAVALRDPLWYLAKYGSFETGEQLSTPWATRRSSPNAKPDDANGAHNVNWDQQHNNGTGCANMDQCADGEPDGYFLARRPELLEKRLNEVFDRELDKSNTAVSVSSAELVNGSFKYIAKFSESDALRSGTVEASQLDSQGKFGDVLWSAGATLAAASNSQRQVITNTPVSGVETGVAFNEGLAADRASATEPLSPFLTAMAGSADTPEVTARKLIAYMRGARSDEGTLFRNRPQGLLNNIMGPVVGSTPWVQDPASSARYTDGDFPSGTPSYAEFVSGRTARHKVLWVGSHDGMLHGFEATTGAPMLSYVPSPVVSRLLSTFSGSTAQAVPLVDGSPFTADVIKGAGTGDAAWRTYLFGGLGRGGKAVFALDVTNTGTGTNTSNASGDLLESNASTLFKWIFTSADDNDLGYVTTGPTTHRTSGQAHQVVRLNNGKFGLLVPNGYQSANGRAALYILYADGPGTGGWSETGTNPSYRKLLTLGSDAGNGLMGVTWVDLNNDGTADVVYGTDLRGNVWKFDIRSADPADWGGAFKRASTAGPVNVPFFTTTACGRTATGLSTSCTNEIAITTNPVATQPPYGGVMISFGTGKALTSGDFPNATMANRFISVWDKGRYAEDQVYPPPDVTDFTPPTLPSLNTRFSQLLLRRNSDGQVYRVKVNASGAEVAVPADSDDVAFSPDVNDGWYFNFPSDGEQLISSPTARRSFVSFTSVRPLSSAEKEQTCVSDANGTFYAINPSTGGAIKGLLKVVTNGSDVSVAYGQATLDQQITATSDRSKGSAQGKITVRMSGQRTDDTGNIGAPNYRLQWREIPGMKTK